MPTRIRRVLAIEDDEDVCTVIRFALVSAGVTLEIARNGIEGVAMARNERPDLILCDLMIPGCDGIEVLRQLRGAQPIVTSPLIFLTSAARNAFKDRSPVDIGALGVIAKPFDPTTLWAHIEALYRRSSPAETPAQKRRKGWLR